MESLSIPSKIETERLILGRLRYEDAEEIFYSYASKPEATRFLAWPTHQSIADTRSFLEFAIKGWDRGTDYSFSIRLKASSRLIGAFGLVHDHGRIQFGYVISPTHWNNGYATEACRRVMSLLREHPGLYRVSTFADADNKESIRVLEKSGLLHEATLHKWLRFVNQDMKPKDCALYYLPLGIDAPVK